MDWMSQMKTVDLHINFFSSLTLLRQNKNNNTIPIIFFSPDVDIHIDALPRWFTTLLDSTTTTTMTLTISMPMTRRQCSDLSPHQSLRHRCLRPWGYFGTTIKIIRATAKTLHPSQIIIGMEMGMASRTWFNQLLPGAPRQVPAMRW